MNAVEFWVEVHRLENRPQFKEAVSLIIHKSCRRWCKPRRPYPSYLEPNIAKASDWIKVHPRYLAGGILNELMRRKTKGML